MKHLKKVVVAAGLAMAMESTFAAEPHWIGQSGGRWSESKNWSTKKVPTKDNWPWFSDYGEPMEIVVDNKVWRSKIWKFDASDAPELTPITFTSVGGGSLDIADGTYGANYKGRHLTVNCPVVGYSCQINGGGSLTVGESGHLMFTNGLKAVENSRITLNGGRIEMISGSLNGASGGILTVNGGQVTIEKGYYQPRAGLKSYLNGGSVESRVDLRTTSTITENHLEIDGGMLKVPSSYFYYTPTACNLVFKRGILDIGVTMASNTCFFGGVGSTLITRKNSLDAICPFYKNGGSAKVAKGDVIQIDGTVIATNGNNSAMQVPQQVTLSGQGTLCLTRFCPYVSKGTVTVKVKRMNLGTTYSAYDITKGGLFPQANGMYVDFPAGMTFGAAADWQVNALYNPTLRVDRVIRFDTRDWADKASKRSIWLSRLQSGADTSFIAEGGGKTKLSFLSSATPLKTLTAKDGTDLEVEGAALRTDEIKLSAGSTFTVSGESARVIAAEADLDPAASIEFKSSVRPEAGVPLLAVRPGTPAADWLASAVTFAGDGYAVAPSVVNGSVFYPGTAEDPKETHEWTGAIDDKWSTAGNWTGSVAPGAGDTLYFGGASGGVSENDMDGLSLYSLFFRLTSGPYLLKGKALTLTSTAGKDEAAVCSYSRFPVRIENDITSAGKLVVASYRDAYVELAGNVTVGGSFAPLGQVQVSGSLTATKLEPGATTSAPLYDKTAPFSKTVRVLRGGKMRLTAFTSFGRNVPVTVDEGGTLTFEGAGFGWRKGDDGVSLLDGKLYVNGLCVIDAPHDYASPIEIAGRGRVEFRKGVITTKSNLGKHAITLTGWDGTLTAGISDWMTVAANATTQTVTLAVANDVDIVALGDGTYGPSPDTKSTTKPTARALALNEGAILTFRTSDPTLDEPVARTFTFTDPIIGKGSLVVDGIGTLVLASSANSIGGGVTVRSGATLACKSEQTFESLRLDEGARLAVGWDNGEFRKITVRGDLDLSGVDIRLDDNALTENDGNWRTLIETTGEITGKPLSTGKWIFCVLKDATGSRLLVRGRRGLSVFIR